jgi:hypothetical protein
MPFATDNVSAVQVNILSEARERSRSSVNKNRVESRASFVKILSRFSPFPWQRQARKSTKSSSCWCDKIFSTFFPLFVISSNFSVELFERIFIFFSFLSVSQHRRKKSFLFPFLVRFWSERRVKSSRCEVGKKASIRIEKRRRPHTHSAFHLITRRIPLR